MEIHKLYDLTGKKYVYIVNRGNTAIKIALQIANEKGYKKLLIQDQGGWITYEQFANKLDLKVKKLKTDYGIINPDDIEDDSILLINSLSGYAAQQPMKLIQEKCKKINTFLINDASGSIGTDEAKNGDIIIGSFGKWKPLELNQGGFIASDNQLQIEEFQIDIKQLNKKINELPDRLNLLHNLCKNIKEDLKNHEIIHKNHQGLVVIVKFKDEQEKQDIINYCNKNKLEITECPRDIRVLDNAISIEVKRLSSG